MIKNLLLSTLISVGVGSSAISVEKENAPRPTTPPESVDFLLLSTIFPTNSITVTDNFLTFNGSLEYSEWVNLPQDFIFEFVYLGDYFFNVFPFVNMDFEFNYNGTLSHAYSINPYITTYDIPFTPVSFSYPISSSVTTVTMASQFLDDLILNYGIAQVRVTVEFQSNIPPSGIPSVIRNFRSNVGFGNMSALNNWVNQMVDGGYDDGFNDGNAMGGTWLGNLVFGTIGGMVGFLFAVADFEVLGVSIMSIITLFVAISMIMLLLKAFK